MYTVKYWPKFELASATGSGSPELVQGKPSEFGLDQSPDNDVTTLGILACFILGIENDINSIADSHSGSNLLIRNINSLKRLS